MAEIVLDVKELAGQNKIHITLVNYKAWRWRLWLGRWFYRLAAWIMWMGIEFEDEGS